MRSKQLSIISKRPKKSDFVFFTERQIDGDDLAKVLTDAGMKIVRHGDYFVRDEDDEVLIPKVASNGHIIVTADKKMETVHLATICESRAKVVILTDNTSGYPQWAAALITYHDQIVRHLLSSDGPMVIRLSRFGITKARYPAEVETRRRQIETQEIIRSKRAR